jgi:hypothetical protein
MDRSLRRTHKKLFASAPLSNSPSALYPGTNRAKCARRKSAAVGSCNDGSVKADGSRGAGEACLCAKCAEIGRYVRRRVASRLALPQGKSKAGFAGVARHARGVVDRPMDASVSVEGACVK